MDNLKGQLPKVLAVFALECGMRNVLKISFN